MKKPAEVRRWLDGQWRELSQRCLTHTQIAEGKRRQRVMFAWSNKLEKDSFTQYGLNWFNKTEIENWYSFKITFTPNKVY